MSICHFSRFFTNFVIIAGTLGLAVVAEAQDNSSENIEEIVVTGSRIPSTSLESAAPVTVFDADYIQLSGEAVLVNLLQQVPALFGSQTGDVGGDSGEGLINGDGTASLNLRNLGDARTLVLVNGRRHVSSRAGTAVVDINTIPTALVERVEVLTGGASAVYGADGVSGVVNFILKDDFEGVDFRVQSGIPDESGGQNYLASATWGTNFADNRGNVAINVEYFRQEKMLNIQRGMTPGWPESLVLNPDDLGVDDPNLPDQIYVPDARFSITGRQGVIFTGDFSFDDWVPDYVGDGDVFDRGLLLPDLISIGGNSLILNNPVTWPLIVEQDRYNINLLSSWEFSDNAQAYLEFKYVDTETSRDTGPGTIDDSITFTFDNPFIPTSIPRVPFIVDDAGGTPNDIMVMGRDNFDLRNRLVDTRELSRTVVGLRGDVTDNIQYDISFVHGQVDREEFTQERIEDRFFAAIDAVIDPATGATVCRSDIDQSRLPTNIHDIDPDVADYFGNFNSDGEPTYSFFSPYNINDFFDPNAPSSTFTPGPNSGCVPLNLWGYQAASQEAINWTHLPTILKSKLTQQVFSAILTGDSEGMFSLPAGPLGFALGMEYREEESRITPDDLNLRGATWEEPLPATTGKFDVTEFFGEVLIPIVSDKTMFQDLSIGGAVRFSDYSTVGDATTWSVNLRWALVDSFALRGSIGQAIRAPNIDELFAPQSNEFFEPTDPCLPTFIGIGSSTREANCTQALADVGLLLSDLSQASGPFRGISGGNPDLLEETSDSYTYGVVWTPTFIDGLSVTLDFWNIEIESAILATDIQDIIDSCYDAPDLNNQFCDTLERSSINGIFTAGQTSTVNIGSFESSGIDLEVNYAFELGGFGDAYIRLVGTKLDNLDIITVPGGELADELGQLNTLLGGPAPEEIVNLDLTWTRQKWSVNYQYTYVSSMLRVGKRALAQKPDIQYPFDTKSRKRHDLSAVYRFNDNLQIFGGVNNFTKPSREIGFIPVDRVYFFGVRYSKGG